jgi:hypothetical protein
MLVEHRHEELRRSSAGDGHGDIDQVLVCGRNNGHTAFDDVFDPDTRIHQFHGSWQRLRCGRDDVDKKGLFPRIKGDR